MRQLRGPPSRPTARVAWRIAALAMVFVACGRESPPPPLAIDASAPLLEGEHRVHGEIRFADVRVSDIVVAPSPIEPGQPVTLSLTVEGLDDPRSARVAIGPPRPASRQVAQGGVDAPPRVVPDDPRMQWVAIDLVPGAQRIDLPPLPSPWHPRRAVVTLALEDPATAGPRRADGTAVLALVPVTTSPTAITAPHVDQAIAIDGALDEPAWDRSGTPLVESLDGEPWDGPPTTLWIAWDDQMLYAAVHVVDSDVWSEHRRHDDPLWEQEVFELFVFADDDDRDYLELQLSPRGVTFDARFARHRQGDRAWTSTWRTAAIVDGTIDDRDDHDAGWTAEVAIPWAEICAETAATCPPRAGMTLRMNAFRFERPAGGRTVGLALSPTRVPDFHAVANAAILTLTR